MGREAARPGCASGTRPRRSSAAQRESAFLSAAEWAAKGRAARRAVSRSSHADWAAAADRPDPVALLGEQAEGRGAELVPVRHGRMPVSPSAVFRGAASIMVAYVAGTPDSGLAAQLCGDAELSTFCGCASPERQTPFDIDDFDETLSGPWEWDVTRLAASIEIAGRHFGLFPAARQGVVEARVREHRDAIRSAAETGL